MWMERKASEAGIVDLSFPPPYAQHHNHAPIEKTKSLWLSSSKLASANTNPNHRLSVEQSIKEDVVKIWSDETNHSWKDFTNNTTFHGVKYIFEESPFRIRRILWVICFLAAILFFIIQVAIRITDYYKRNTNTDVQVLYESSLKFPAVTICNQNAFRMTKVVEREMYEFVDNVFASSMTDLDFNNYTEFESVNSTDFLIQCSHQMEDMVDSCSWNAEPCHVSEFKRVDTDMGTCFTFNHDVKNPKYAQEAGAGYGLRIIMNVEQYQAMRGPQNDAGLKLLLHAQDEFPAVKDLGFSVAPGTHTLVGVHTTHVSSLEPPWGICSSTSPSMSTCKMQCKSRMVYSKCGCVVDHMTIPGLEYEICNLPQQWGCVRNVTEHVKPAGDTCNCTIPCDRTVYEPRLSYAQLSRINIDRLVLNQPDKKAIVKTNFEDSLETLQRVDSSIVESDNTLMTNIETEYNNLKAGTTQAIETYNSSSEISAALTLLEAAAFNDKERIENLEDYFEDVARMMSRDTIRMADRLLDYLFDQIGLSDGDFDYFDSTLSYSDQCIAIITLTLPVPDDTDEQDLWDTYMHGMKENNWSPGDQISQAVGNNTDPEPPEVVDCNHEINTLIVMSQQYYHLLIAVYNHSDNILTTYENVTDIIFEGSGKDPSSVSHHAECLDFMANSYRPLFLEGLLDLISILDDFRQSRNKPELRQALADLADNVNSSAVNSYEDYLHDVKEKCFWVDTWVDSDDFEDIIDDAKDNFEKAGEWFQVAQNMLTSYVVVEMENILEVMNDDVAEYVNETTNYLAGRATKLSIIEELTSIETTNAFEEIIEFGKKMNSYFGTYLGKTQMSLDNINQGLEILLSSDVPLLTNTTLNELESIQAIRNLNSVLLSPYINTMLITDGFNLERIRDIVINYLRGPEEDVNFALADEGIDKLTKEVNDLSGKLLEYKETADMDADFLLNNFLHVDIFYTELSYSEVQQHKAFELISLFGEVGGFMGLLLGASVLSVIEFVDYVVMVAARKCGKRERVSHTRVKTFA